MITYGDIADLALEIECLSEFGTEDIYLMLWDIFWLHKPANKDQLKILALAYAQRLSNS